MPLAQNSRGVRGLIYVDELGVPHTILLAYLGDKVVWDGHINETLQVPALAGQSVFPTPVVSADALIVVPLVVGAADFPAPDLVSGGVTIRPDVLIGDAVAFAPVLHSDHTLDVTPAVSMAEMPVPEVRVVFGVTPDSMIATSVMHAPVVTGDALVAAPVLVGVAEMFPPIVGSWAIVDAPVMVASATAALPTVSASARVDAEVASSTAAALVPSVSAGSRVDAEVSTATAQAPVPTVSGGGFSRQKMVKSGDIQADQNPVTGWVSDGTYPATIASNKLVVAGGGPATVNAVVDGRSANGWGYSTYGRLYVNGSQVASVTWANTAARATKTVTWSGTVAAGALIHIEWTNTSNIAGDPLYGGTSYVEVVPT
ncbi:hypothetical protein JVX90_00365 [Gordonia sp. PDNC005]|uniref:hypothetical protein n=1 Tax=Gordonia sp. PDNC005 TaxID=2811424 RepID=UPI0019650EA0|nr:hypothetical protein [Gordonia sp. PDNC005]QRY62766.1 hypothetical protein JVX90_00365 [Gordonia sp. PDNC005]